MRPLGFCRYLADHGWSVSALAADPVGLHPPVEVDERLSQRLPPHVQIVRVPSVSFWRRLASPHNALTESRSPATNARSQATTRSPNRLALPRRALSELRRSANGFVQFPDRQRAWFRAAVRAGLGSPTSFDAVLATGSPWTSLRVGLALARRWRVPYIADFRDPWARNLSQRDIAPPLRPWAKRLEREVCSEASLVITTTEELRDQLAQDYPELPDRFVTITNGFDDARLIGGSPASGRFELCHFGTVYAARAPLNLLRAVETLADEGRLDRSSFRLRFVGTWDVTSSACNALAERLAERGLVTREAPIPHEQCLADMQRASALLVLQSGFPSRSRRRFTSTSPPAAQSLSWATREPRRRSSAATGSGRHPPTSRPPRGTFSRR